jgi:acetyl-CoA carboxylase biotin carboxyl carrier protein
LADSVDTRQLKELIELMERHGLVEIELLEEGRRIRLRKDAAQVVAPAPPPSAAEAPRGKPKAPEGSPPPPPPGLLEFHSPMVGTFYRASSPESDPFVEAGDAIDQGDTLGIIEAMKVMNEIRAEYGGTIEKICVENGQAVEYGETLFLIRPE